MQYKKKQQKKQLQPQKWDKFIPISANENKLHNPLARFLVYTDWSICEQREL